MSKKKVAGSVGKTAGRSVSTGSISTGNISGQVAVGINIRQIQTVSTLSNSDKKELLDSLIEFRKELPKLGLLPDEQSIVNGKVTETIKEAEKEKPDLSKIKSTYASAIETIKGVGGVIEKVATSETTKKILKILGLGLSLL
jgi:hypothetical protein